MRSLTSRSTHGGMTKGTSVGDTHTGTLPQENAEVNGAYTIISRTVAITEQLPRGYVSTGSQDTEQETSHAPIDGGQTCTSMPHELATPASSFACCARSRLDNQTARQIHIR